ncbi:MAG: toprim domain-containing protein [Cardiobacteriaceae bacterium]|nr:toprim domain-containing protein [Cardiobacteriaceae bacterium]
MNINEQQYERLLRSLIEDYDFKEVEGEYLNRGICPECGKRELFISKSNPWRLCCNRRNRCGFSASTFELYRHSLFADWSQYYPHSESNPKATADAYLSYARGFNLEKIRSLYSQEHYYDHKTKQHTATVRFTLCDGNATWERFIDNTDCFSGQKGRALGSYKGLWWQMPNETFEANEIWITEGIFDALSLIQIGYTAISSISCGNYPDAFFSMLRQKSLKPLIIFAMDNDPAGKEAIKKHVERARNDGWNVRAAIPPPHQDWNDLLLAGKLEDSLSESFYNGELLIAESAIETARIMYKKNGMNAFHFSFANRTYWFSLDMTAYQAALDNMEAGENDDALKQASVISEIANCLIQPLYFQRSRDSDESRYFVRISRAHGADTQNTFTGSHLGASTDFKKRLLSVCPGALYDGSTKQLNRIIRTDFSNLRTVETIDYIGYVQDLDAYVFRDFAVSKGKIISRNNEQFLALDRLRTIKTICDIDIHLSKEDVNFDWVDDFVGAFSEIGLVALAFFTGSLYANQIREKQMSWPFLELVGDPGAGKSTLLVFLWKLFGRKNYEGFDPMKSSVSGRSRVFNKVSGLPIVLIEGDHSADHHRKFGRFDLSELKDTYNGRPVYTRGSKTSGLETYDPPFRGSIVIAQNRRIEADEAVLSRIIPLFCSRKNLSAKGKAHADILKRAPVEKLSSYLTHMLKNSKRILEDYFSVYGEYEERLAALVSDRIAQNGAQMMSMLRVIANQVDIDEITLSRAFDFIEKISVEREQSMQMDDPIVSDFWDRVEYLESTGRNVNHSNDPGLIAINLPHFEFCARSAGIQVSARTELNRFLDKSIRYEFIARRSVRSKITQKVIKCLIFKNQKGEVL